MEKNQAIQNQKVFVTLDAVVKMARRYDVVCNRIQDLTVGEPTVGAHLAEKRTLEFVIEALSLPIERRMSSPKPKPVGSFLS